MNTKSASPLAPKLVVMSEPPERPRVSDIPPTTLRLPPELRARLLRESNANGRSLSREVEIRLQATFRSTAEAVDAVVRESVAPYAADTPPPLNDAERALVAAFRLLSTEKQLALLTFVKR